MDFDRRESAKGEKIDSFPSSSGGGGGGSDLDFLALASLLGLPRRWNPGGERKLGAGMLVGIGRWGEEGEEVPLKRKGLTTYRTFLYKISEN